MYFVDIPQKQERILHRQVPPELTALAEYHADVPGVLHTLLPRAQAQHPAIPRVRLQYAGKNLHRGGFSRAVGADVAYQFSRLYFKGNPLQRLNFLDVSRKQALFRAQNVGFRQIFR